jgi:hypothetical protein
MPYLTKDDILRATDVDTDDLEVPEWGGTVRVRGLDALYMRELMQTGFVNASSGQVDLSKLDLPGLVARSIVDEAGNRVFDAKDVKQLASKSFAPLMKIATKALQLSGIATAEEDTEKNLSD